MEDPGLVPGLLVFLLLAILGVGLVLMTSSSREVRFLIKVFVIAFSLRFAVSIIIYQFGLVELLKDEDSSGWLVGKAWYEDWLRDDVRFFDLPIVLARAYDQHHKGYYYLIGVLFYFTSLPFRLPVAALNCFIGAWTVIVSYRTARFLFDERNATQVAWWICVYPSLIIWSAQTLKEPVVILLESLVICSCVAQQRQGFTIKHMTIIVLATVLLIPFRFYAAYLGGGVFLLTFLLRGITERQRMSPRAFFYSIVIAVVSFGVVLFLLDRERDAELFQHYNLEGIERYRSEMAVTSGSGVVIDADLHSSGGIVVSLLVGVSHLLFAPFPWQLVNGSFRMFLVTPEVVLWWWLLITGVIPGLRQCIRTRLRDVLPLLIMLVGLGLLYSLMFSNIGLVYRQRAQLLPWLLIFYVVGRDRFANFGQAVTKLRPIESGSAPKALV